MDDETWAILHNAKKLHPILRKILADVERYAL